MRLLFFIILVFLLNNCSFDKKSGIWNNESIENDQKNIFKEFKKISSSRETFKQNVPFQGNFSFKTPEPISNFTWSDIFYNSQNNYDNFYYNETNQIIFKSKKLSKSNLDFYKVYEDRNIIITDSKGNIIIYSIDQKKIILNFNFYKKQFKKIKKELNVIVENGIIFTADNLGFLYAYDYKQNKVIWAKNYKIPFSSNLKIYKDKLIASNQENNLYILNKINGNLIQLIPTEESPIKNQFKNNLSISGDNLIFLNSFGSLYSINLKRIAIKWFNNFNQSTDLSPSNLFEGNTVVSDDSDVIISNNTETYFIDLVRGNVKKKYNFSSNIKPIIINKTAFFLTKNNFLVSINMKNKEIIYSYDINKIEELAKIKIKKDSFKNLLILNRKIFIFLENSEVAKFSLDGQFLESSKLPAKIKSAPIILDGSIIYLNDKNKLIILN